jgi:hypothetical protein
LLHLPYSHSGIEVTLTEGVNHFNPLQARELQDLGVVGGELEELVPGLWERGHVAFGTRAVAVGRILPN